MDYKTFKQDLTYACKKFTKEGKVLSAWGDNLFIQDGAFVYEGEHLDALEMFVLIKGYTPSSLMTMTYHDRWVGPKDGKSYEYHIQHYTGYNLSMVDVILEQAQISREDLYAFLDGLDNVEFTGKNDFYTVGTYIREKFIPLGVRSSLLSKKDHIYLDSPIDDELVQMFYSMTVRGKTTIYELKCARIKANLNPWERLYQVHAPEQFKGEKWYSMFLFFQLKHCQDEMEKGLRQEFERLLKKKGIAYTEEDVQAKLAQVQVVML